MTPQEEIREREDVELLAAMMGGEVDLNEARRVLRKHKGDVQKAADAILEGDRGLEEITTAWHTPTQETQEVVYPDPTLSTGIQKTSKPLGPSPTVIDLTSEDNDYTQTWLDPSQNEAKFGPSQRAPDPAWQMVTSNTPIDTNHDDRTLKDAIQASLADFRSDELEVFPMENTVREGGRPIALRPEDSGIAYAALTIQALSLVPQVCESVARLKLPDIENIPQDTYDGSAQHAIWKLVELFTNLDLAQLSAIIDKEVLPSLQPTSWDGNAETLGDLTTAFIKNLGHLIESHLNAQKMEEEPDARLFYFLHGQAESRGRSYKIDKSSQKGSVVVVDVGDPASPNDLVSKLSVNLSRYDGTTSTHDVIFEPSQLVMFQLKPIQNNPYSTSSVQVKPPSDPFVYPKSFYLDRFILENLPLSNEKRVLEREMLDEISELTKQKELLIHYNNRDTLKDLRASLHYYENIAESKDNPERHTVILQTAQKLKSILAEMVNRIAEIDFRIEQLQADLAVIFDCLELQNHQYDLRAVLMHTGLPGRKQIYSYVQDSHGMWWKTVDYAVTEVPEETVLTDPTGLHLGAGPYMLIYSRHLSDEEINAPIIWPKIFADGVELANQTFLSYLPPEVASKASVPLTRHDSSLASLSFPFTQASIEDKEEQAMDVVNDSGT